MQLLRTHINKFVVQILLTALFTQFVIVRDNFSILELKNNFDSEQIILEYNSSFSSPCDLENNLINFRNAIQKKSPEMKKTSITDYFFFDETELSKNNLIAYSINIIFEINIQHIEADNIDLRGPPIKKSNLS